MTGSPTRPGRPVATASELAMCFGGVALEGGLKGVFQLDTFKTKLALSGSSKVAYPRFKILIRCSKMYEDV